MYVFYSFSSSVSFITHLADGAEGGAHHNGLVTKLLVVVVDLAHLPPPRPAPPRPAPPRPAASAGGLSAARPPPSGEHRADGRAPPRQGKADARGRESRHYAARGDGAQIGIPTTGVDAGSGPRALAGRRVGRRRPGRTGAGAEGTERTPGSSSGAKSRFSLACERATRPPSRRITALCHCL